MRVLRPVYLIAVSVASMTGQNTTSQSFIRDIIEQYRTSKQSAPQSAVGPNRSMTLLCNFGSVAPAGCPLVCAAYFFKAVPFKGVVFTEVTYRSAERSRSVDLTGTPAGFPFTVGPLGRVTWHSTLNLPAGALVATTSVTPSLDTSGGNGEYEFASYLVNTETNRIVEDASRTVGVGRFKSGSSAQATVIGDKLLVSGSWPASLSQSVETETREMFEKAVVSTPQDVVLEVLPTERRPTELPWGAVRLVDTIDSDHFPGATPKELKKLRSLAGFVLKVDGKADFPLYINTTSRYYRELSESYHKSPETSAAPVLLWALMAHEITHIITQSDDDVLPLEVEKAVIVYHKDHRSLGADISRVERYLEYLAGKIAEAKSGRSTSR